MKPLNAPGESSDANPQKPKTPEKDCKGNTLPDNPSNLRLVPMRVEPGNHEITYRLRTADGKQTPNGNWYVFEHQTQHVSGTVAVGPQNYVSPYPKAKEVNRFSDTLGGTRLDSYQSFTISRQPDYDPKCQFDVIIRYGNQDYGFQHVWSRGGPVGINNLPQLPTAGGTLPGEF